MKPEEFYQRLQEVHGITLTDVQKEQFHQYFQLLVEWNEKMNLTAITDEEGVYLKHFYDSLALGFIMSYRIKYCVMSELEQDFQVFH